MTQRIFGREVFDDDYVEKVANKGVAGGYLGIELSGYVDASKLGTGYAGAGAKYLSDNGSYKPVTASVAISTASVPFTDGDVAKRVSVADAGITATDKIIVTVRRPNLADDSEDGGFIYVTNVVRIYAGGFDVRIVALDLSGTDTTEYPPNETITLCYQVAA